MKCANYLCNAAIILTAERLNLSVGMEDYARQILATKQVPEVEKMGTLIKQAQKAIDIVNHNRKGELADTIALQILKDYNCLSEK